MGGMSIPSSSAWYRSSTPCSTSYGVSVAAPGACRGLNARTLASRTQHVLRSYGSAAASPFCTMPHLCSSSSTQGSVGRTAFCRLPRHAAAPCLRAMRRSTVSVCCSTAETGGSPRRPPPSQGPAPWRWLQNLAAKLQPQTVFRILTNALALYVLMRVWPVGGRTGLGDAENVAVQVPFSEFVRRVKQNEVHSVSMDGLAINFALRPGSPLLGTKRPQGTENAKVTLHTMRPADYQVPYDMLEKNHVVFSATSKQGTPLMSVLVYVMYFLLLLSALNRLPIKLPSAQKGPVRKHSKQARDGSEGGGVTFADVAGVDEAKEELQEIVEYLRAPERFSKLGARPPCGVLLVGPPGTGKTMLAKAVAGEADVPFFSISASEFVELYVGMGAMRVRELFAAARKEAPSIVFIDEIDAVAKGRDQRLRSVGNDEREQTLNQLLTELDGFDSDQKESTVICIAATNRPDVLDQALLRPGRFDRRVAVERPDRVGRLQILKVHLQRRGLPLEAGVDAEAIAAMTTGFTGADLANLVNEAALLAGRAAKSVVRALDEVGRLDFEAAVLRSVAGIEKKRSILVGVEKQVVAKHEAGHAVLGTAVSRLIPGSQAVEKLSIVPRSGGALGFTYTPQRAEDRALLFDCEIRGQLAMLMGGRAAEQLTCGAVSTGAVDDIRRATDLAYRAVTEFGLSAAVGPINVSVLATGGGGEDGGAGAGGWMLQPDASAGGALARVVQAEVRGLLEGALTVAMHVVLFNRAIHDGLSTALAKEERLDGEKLQKWLMHVKAPGSLSQFVTHAQLPDRAALGIHFPASALSLGAALDLRLDPSSASLGTGDQLGSGIGGQLGGDVVSGGAAPLPAA